MKKLLLAAMLTILGITSNSLARGCWNTCYRPCSSVCQQWGWGDCRPQYTLKTNRCLYNPYRYQNSYYNRSHYNLRNHDLSSLPSRPQAYPSNDEMAVPYEYND